MSHRMEQIARFLEGPVIADIGTDHGLLVEMALQREGIERVIATDISPHSLQKCVDRFQGSPVVDKIETMVTDGLKGIDTGAVDTVVIAGMGGHRIIGVLQDALSQGKLLRRLVLSPQKGEREVRRFLHESGFRIEADLWVEEAGKTYTILVATPGSESYNTENEYRYGRIPLRERDPVLKEWIEKEHKVQSSVLDGLDSEGASAERVRQKLRELEEVLNAL